MKNLNIEDQSEMLKTAKTKLENDKYDLLEQKGPKINEVKIEKEDIFEE